MTIADERQWCKHAHFVVAAHILPPFWEECAQLRHDKTCAMTKGLPCLLTNGRDPGWDKVYLWIRHIHPTHGTVLVRVNDALNSDGYPLDVYVTGVLTGTPEQLPIAVTESVKVQKALAHN